MRGKETRDAAGNRKKASTGRSLFDGPPHLVRVRDAAGGIHPVEVQPIYRFGLAVDVAAGLAEFLGLEDVRYVAAPRFAFRVREKLEERKLGLGGCTVEVVKRSRVEASFPVTERTRPVAITA